MRKACNLRKKFHGHIPLNFNHKMSIKCDAAFLKVTLLHGCFSQFLNSTNDTKSCKTSQMIKQPSKNAARFLTRVWPFFEHLTSELEFRISEEENEKLLTERNPVTLDIFTIFPEIKKHKQHIKYLKNESNILRKSFWNKKFESNFKLSSRNKIFKKFL